MRRALLVVVLALVLAPCAHAAARSVEQPSLNAVASQIAGQDVEVRCWTDDNLDPDGAADAWGYVRPLFPIIYLDPAPCEGALALQTQAMKPLWQLALGALVLSHEAYHLKSSLAWTRRTDEAQTECRAVKRVPQTLLELGATQRLADAALPWALAEHYKITSLHYPGKAPPYDYPSCKVPVFADFWR